MKLQSKLSNISFSIETCSSKNYGIMLSGGLDSAVLLSLLLQEDRNIMIQPFSILKHDHSYKYVNPIIEYFNEQFEINIPKTILVGNPDVHHRMQGTLGVGEVFRKYLKIQMLFSGLNQNPPEPFGDTNWTKPNRPAPDYQVPKMQFPFLHLHKTDIVELMFENNQEALMDLTHTCTEMVNGRCGKCFQCNERSWAFEQLNKIDTGKL
jgi:hypothetical protein